MKLLIGLGNPGRQYKNTRHNLGFMVLDEIAGKNKWQEAKKGQALYLLTSIDQKEVELYKPQTFMNNSGLSITYALKKHNLRPADLIVVHDDKDLSLGKIKVQTGAGPAGHNGVKSIIEKIGSQDFTRIRVGIASDNPKKMSDTAKFVLNRFSLLEKSKVKQVIKEVIEEVKKLI